MQARPGSAAADAVRRLGGRVTRELPIVHGFAATLPAARVAALTAAPGVASVSSDTALHVRADTPPPVGPSTRPAAGTGVALAPRVVGAPAAWAAGVTGAGVTVALLDTGVTDVPDLAGRVVPVRQDLGGPLRACYDLSGEGSCRDSYGHGSFMAGLIAGDGRSSGGQATGTAPGARVLSVKVAGASGAADVSTVLAGIEWVVAFKDTYGISVLNLSLGTDSTGSWRSDPLNYAVERAWAAGITVVVAAANNGPAAGTVDKPGDDPWVVTVGAADARGTVGLGDDRSPDFSSRGPTREGVAKPDLVAPGAAVSSLVVPGSTLQRLYPVGAAGRYRLGSGTSMATAVVSGAAALVLQARPGTTPDELKHVLTAAARPDVTRDRTLVGAGMLDAGSAVLAPSPGAANAGLARSTGLGSLTTSRGSPRMAVDGLVPTLLDGRQTAQLLLWDPLGFLTGTWSPATWYTSVNALVGWNTATWASQVPQWSGHDWTGHDWTGHDWTGSSWQGHQDGATAYGSTGPGSASYGAWR